MWGILSKIAAVSFVILSIICIIKRKAYRGNVRRIVLLVISVLIALYVGIFPIENLFFSFTKAEDVFQYACRGQMVGIIDGMSSSLIVYRTTSDPYVISFMIAPKTPSGYKIGHYFTAKKVAHVASSGDSLTIYGNETSSDYYVLLYGFVDQQSPLIEDNYGSAFTVSTLKVDGRTSTYHFVALTHLDDYHGSYQLTVAQTDREPILLSCP